MEGGHTRSSSQHRVARDSQQLQDMIMPLCLPTWAKVLVAF
jgi:hypothetical protein